MSVIKCLNCGVTNEKYICDDCLKDENVERICDEILIYPRYPDKCTNEHIADLAASLDDKYAIRDIIPDILESYSDGETKEFLYCLYYRTTMNDGFIDSAYAFLDKYGRTSIHSQKVISKILDHYDRKDFESPMELCEFILSSDGLAAELYCKASVYFSRIGEYEKAVNLLDTASRVLPTSVELITPMDKMDGILKSNRKDLSRYSAGNPYWPQNEEGRKVIAEFLDAKGIKHPRITLRPKKVPENEFEEITECYEHGLATYCAFWCNHVLNSIANVRDIYQISAVRVIDNEIADTFEEYICPNESRIQDDAAKKAGVALSTIKDADEVDLVINRFFDFVGDSVLVSTEALTEQSRILSRAARYSGMKKINNPFLDICDMADDLLSDSMQYINRNSLLEHFGLMEGTNALAKAMNNYELYRLLSELEK